ncbi:MAG: Gfo/Idh/MocA family protein [Jiangellaceae bacterium]
MQDVRFGVIGLGLMGKEFASAAARWLHLDDVGARPVLTAVCDTSPDARAWFEERVPTVTFATDDYRELLARSDVDAVYVAVPHHLHEEVYLAVLQAGKHLLGEKPFGIDQAANARLGEEIARHPDLLVRCSSEFPFFPGAQRIHDAVRAGELGTVIDVEAGLLHSSDLNPHKPLNWKRRRATNGAYGCMGDLGLHVLHLPLRLGWRPTEVRAHLQDLVPTRPDGHGGTAPCDTWDNATLLTRVRTDASDFPLLLHTKRIAPGHTNTWTLTVHGTRTSLSFSSKYPKTLRTLRYEPGGPQTWAHEDLGYDAPYPTLTGKIFEFGFPDAVLQMWAAFCDELAHGAGGMRQPFTCATPEEVAETHRVFTDALRAAGDPAGGAAPGAQA